MPGTPDPHPPTSRSRLGRSARFAGNAHSEETLEITGIVEGEFSSAQSVEVYPPAEVRGAIRARGLRVVAGADVEAAVEITSRPGSWWQRLLEGLK
ncbi:MAG: polymer-forming cytoskeletal protein [Verrucomicrobiota bacterium]